MARVDLCERCGLPITDNECVWRGDRRIEHSPKEDCIRLARAEIERLRNELQRAQIERDAARSVADRLT